jgi:hypothetical protein
MNGHFALRLDGETTLLAGAAGGEIFAEVAEVPAGPGPFVKKHLTHVRFEDITAAVGFAMSDALFDWIAAAWAASDQPKDGALLAVDNKFAIKSERQFTAARIAATSIPTLDAASKSASPLSVRLTPASMVLVPGAGKLQLGNLKQRLWQASNFRLEIDGLDCSKVSRIESFTVVFLLPNLTALARIELQGLGIFRLAAVQSETGQIARLTAGLYCERMSLHRESPSP